MTDTTLLPFDDPAVTTDDSDAQHLPEDMLQTVEALLFAAHEPLTASTLAPALNGTAASTLDVIMAELNRRLTLGGHPMRVRKVAGGYQMHVLPAFGPAIEAALVKTKIQRLSRAGLETLAIIAYKQPCSTPEIENIRGVSCGGVLSTLMERNLITIKGRSDGPGRPLLYGTTKEFLKYFGLNSINDLPSVEELEKILAENKPGDTLPMASSTDQSQQPDNSRALVLIHPPEESGRFFIRDVVCHESDLNETAEGCDNGGNGSHDHEVADDEEERVVLRASAE
jgi:segregation and condensation protein B